MSEQETKAHSGNQYQGGVSPRENLTALRIEDLKTLTHARTIYDERVHIRKEGLRGREPMRAFLDDIHKNNIAFETSVIVKSILLTCFLPIQLRLMFYTIIHMHC